MANEAGIDLILRSPGLKPIMDAVIDDMKELSKQEKLAEEATIDLEIAQTKLRDQMKQAAITNQNIKKSIEDVTIASNDQTNAVVSGGEKQRSGILNTIKVYFQQRQALKATLGEMVNLRQEIFALDQRQRSLVKSAQTSDKAYQEFTANKTRIELLSKKLQELNGDHRFLNKSIQETEKKYATLGKGLSIVKNLAILAVAAISAVVVGGLAAITKIISSNDQVENLFVKVKKSFVNAKDELANALSPIGFAVGNVFTGILTRVTDFILKNQQAIFDWAVNAGGNIVGFAASVGIAFDNVGIFFKKLAADVKFNALLIKAGIHGGLNLLLPSERKDIVEARSEIERLSAELRDGQEKAREAFDNGKKGFVDGMKAMGLAGASVKNLTKEQLAEIAKLRAEYDKLTESINKQASDLDIKQAGIAGVILKSELAAVALEKEAQRWEFLARKFGATDEAIAKMLQKFKALTSDIRQSAKDEVLKNLTEQLKVLETRAADAVADDQESAIELKLARTLGAIDKERDALKEKILDLQRVQEELGGTFDFINEINRRSNEALDRLASDAIRDATNERAKKEFDNSIKTLNRQIAEIKETKEKLKETLSNENLSGETRAGLELEVKVNDKELLILETKLSQLKQAGPVGLFIDVSSNVAQAVDDINTQIGNIKAGEIQAPKIPFLDKITHDIESAFVDLASSLEDIFGPNFIARFGGAFGFLRDIAISSIDAQIEAIDRLVDARNESVNKLEDDVKFEAELKALGLANDFDILKKQLDDERTLRDDALKSQEEINKKRIKIQAQQDSISQASSLASAIANMFKGITATLNPGAFLVAIIASGVMLAAFAAAKIKAAALARAYKGSRRIGETFDMLAPGEGYDDRPGRDRGLSVVDSKGRLRGFMGGQEFLHKESVSVKHRHALSYLNENEHLFQKIDLLAWLKLAERDGVTNTIRLDRVVEKNNRLKEKIIIVQSSGISKSDLEEAIEKVMKKHADSMIAYHESRPDYIPDEWMKNYHQINSKSKKHFQK